MGLLNVSHTSMTQSVVNLQADLLKNPFYLFSDKKGTIVDYYNINKAKSTLDDSLKLAYDNKGEQSPLRYNLIHNFYLYGLDRVALNLENGEFGLEASEVTGDAIILPDTITPYTGDCFTIDMVKNKFQFYVTSVTMDTFDNGGNYWKIEYLLDRQDIAELRDNNVVEEYEFVSGNIGTQYTPVLLKSKYDVCAKLDQVSENLKEFFKSLFYNDKVQTYTFIHLYRVCKTGMNSDFFYDPYLIEFCIKNKILANGNRGYDYLDHKTTLRSEFPIRYARSIWKIIETCEKDELPSCKHSSSAQYIDDPGTIFGTRYEDYFELTYTDPNPIAEMFAPALDILDGQVIGHILENQLFDYNSKYGKYNILIKYFNHYSSLKVEDIIPLERITEIENNMENYFYLPMAIYVIEYYIKDAMNKNAEL